MDRYEPVEIEGIVKVVTSQGIWLEITMQSGVDQSPDESSDEDLDL